MNWYLKVLKQYADFEGRARRQEMWMFILINVIAIIVLSLISPVLSSIYQLAVFVPTIAVQIRRMHDLGKSGWYILIPIYNFILSVTEGDKEDNSYGPDPKSESLN